MEFRKERISLDQAREMDMVTYLSNLGHEPSKIRNNDYWYLSPLRNEKTASFKVNRHLNRWYDHGAGRGGNLIDFAIAYHDCTIGELLDNLTGNFSLQLPDCKPSILTTESSFKIKVLNDFSLKSTALLKYLNQRRIDLDIAQKYCREVRYEINGNTFYGIGFRNDSGGFEIRNEYFKLSSSPKDITTYKNGADQVAIFEGFMDFLSFKTLHQNQPKNSFDFVVLNSVSFFERARPFMDQHSTNLLYLDRDPTGLKITEYALSLGNHYSDQSMLYDGYKDLNDWVANIGNAKKPFTKS